jgi:general stress protein 26
VCWAHPGKDIYVSVSGSARVVENTAKKNDLWSKMAEAWFPGGVDDPDLALVEVKMTKAHYWNVKENKITQLFEMVSAAVTGKPPAYTGETGDVRLTSPNTTMPG